MTGTKTRNALGALGVVALVLVGPSGAGAQCSPGAPLFTDAGVEAQCFEGNLPGDDPIQVCHEIAALLGTSYTTDVQGVKVDPPANYPGDPTVTLSADGKFLAWSSTDVEVLAFLIKGGPNFNLYDYEGSGITSDGNLHSPFNNAGRIPGISHYHFCYEPAGDGTGCTPGYWRNHADRWVGVSPGDDFDTTFGVDLFNPDITLGAAIALGGGGINALARHATAALLNAYGGVPNVGGEDCEDGATVSYPYSVAEVIQLVQDAVANGTIEETKDLFAAANEAGCPLCGTPACGPANPAACF